MVANSNALKSYHDHTSTIVFFSQVEQSRNRMVVIGRSSPGGEDCVDVEQVAEPLQSYSLLLADDDEDFCGSSVTVCVRYMTNACRSLEFRGII